MLFIFRAWAKRRSIIPAERIDQPILLIRGEKVMLDSGPALKELEGEYNGQFAVVFDAIRELMELVHNPKRRRIGFRVD